jgi:hypothetical protein
MNYHETKAARAEPTTESILPTRLQRFRVAIFPVTALAIGAILTVLWVGFLGWLLWWALV